MEDKQEKKDERAVCSAPFRRPPPYSAALRAPRLLRGLPLRLGPPCLLRRLPLYGILLALLRRVLPGCAGLRSAWLLRGLPLRDPGILRAPPRSLVAQNGYVSFHRCRMRTVLLSHPPFRRKSRSGAAHPITAYSLPQPWQIDHRFAGLFTNCPKRPPFSAAKYRKNPGPA